MTTKVTLVRNPYPVPDISREGNWILDGPYLGQSVSTDDKTWQEKLQPHERLFAHHTLTSIRKDHRLFRPQVPTDSLDYALSSVYKHCKDTFVPKMYTRIQPESLGIETWRVLRNEIKTFIKPPPPLGHPLKKVNGQEEIKHHKKVKNIHTGEESKLQETESLIRDKVRRIHPSSLKLAIDGPHMDQTNAGYSRKIDGTYYNI
ncbi:cilia- and flagella-associated protein 276 [Leptopilina boulardi]|uniref:cilia- and flagella-associated protein 276 n=1 Tax=Leptopilina boulardi TaxID=63433 RepID=UPI0021F5036B|nr:cilia- and flagella-associated protein 276 [Leptopilina boulardi]XP_051161225.1 cilia- and flagella-associated protein 276 [Leptopilina boulardi]XP_051161226.1 cilia- and flagella-associated protein 276 [Leptopilina boulardi]